MAWCAAPVHSDRKIEIRDMLDLSFKYMAAGGIATVIVNGIARAIIPAAGFSLGVGLTLGFGIGPMVTLGALIIHEIFMRILQFGFKSTYARLQEYTPKLRALYREKASLRVGYRDDVEKRISDLRREYASVSWIVPVAPLLATAISSLAAFFLVTSCVGPLAVGPFVGTLLFMFLIALILPQPSDIYYHIAGIIAPRSNERCLSFWQRLLGFPVPARREELP